MTWASDAPCMRPCIPRPGTLAALLLVTLSSLITLGLQAEVPVVDLSGVYFLDEGQEVVTGGLLIDLRRYDSEVESLVLASSDGQDTLRVLVSPGNRPQPSAYARMGDSLRVVGRVSSSGHSMILYCISDSVFVEARSERVLTVRALSEMWQMFLGDELRIRGVVVTHLASEGPRLYDSDLACSILLTGAVEGLEASPFEAVVVGILVLDDTSMGLNLRVVDMSPSG